MAYRVLSGLIGLWGFYAGFIWFAGFCGFFLDFQWPFMGFCPGATKRNPKHWDRFRGSSGSLSP